MKALLKIFGPEVKRKDVTSFESIETEALRLIRESLLNDFGNPDIGLDLDIRLLHVDVATKPICGDSNKKHKEVFVEAGIEFDTSFFNLANCNSMGPIIVARILFDGVKTTTTDTEWLAQKMTLRFANFIPKRLYGHEKVAGYVKNYPRMKGFPPEQFLVVQPS